MIKKKVKPMVNQKEHCKVMENSGRKKVEKQRGINWKKLRSLLCYIK
jgi:hypothetical protein